MVVTVFCSDAIVAVGLKATRPTMFAPVVMPPWTPPERFDGGDRPPAGPRFEGVVVRQPGQSGAGETAADLEPLGGREGDHGLGEVGVELVEDRLAQPRRDVAGDEGDHATQRVAVASSPLDRSRHGLGRPGVRAAGGVGFDHVERDRVGIEVGVDGVDRTHPGQNLDPGDRGQQLPGDGTGGDPPDGLTGRGPAASPMVADAVLGVVGVVGVARSVDVLEMVVGARVLVLVSHHQRQRGAGGPPLEDSREDLDPVGLVPLGDQPTLPGAPAVEVELDLVGGDGKPCGATVEDHADGRAVRLPERRDAEEMPEATGHGTRLSGTRSALGIVGVRR